MICRWNHADECDCCGQCRKPVRSYDDETEERPEDVICSECGYRISGQYWVLEGETVGDCCIEDWLDRMAVLT